MALGAAQTFGRVGGVARGAAGKVREVLPRPPFAVYTVDPKAIWAFVTRQPASFWFINIYLFFEYVRPQTIYPSIAFLPWAFYSIMGALIAFLIEGGVFRKLTFADGLLALFSAIVLASSVFAVYPSESFGELYVYFSWVLIYWLITNVVTTRERFVVFMLGYLIYCFKMSAHGARSWAQAGFMFRTWGTTCAPGWFNNSGECGLQMVIYFSVSLAFVLGLRAYWPRLKRAMLYLMPGTAALTIMGSSSRGGVIGLAAVLLVMLARSKQRARAFIYIGLTAAAIFVALPQGFKDRFTTMGEDGNSQLRLQYWKDGIKIAADYPVLGIGYNNWLKFYRRNYNTEGQVPHNIFVQAGAELGYTGLAAFIALIIGNFVVNNRTRRIAKRQGGDKLLYYMAHGLDGALVGFMVSGFFVTVLYYPFFWINFAMSVALLNVAEIEERGAAAAALAARWRPRLKRAPAKPQVTGPPAGPPVRVAPPVRRPPPMLSPDPVPPGR